MQLSESYPKIRLFVEHQLAESVQFDLPKEQAHYLLNVMRCKTGEQITTFNRQDGEWRCKLSVISKRAASLNCINQLKEQTSSPDIWLAFAPIKSGRIDFLAEKATELGVSALLPVRTERTIVSRVKEDRLLANAISAAEQSERLDVPETMPYQPLQQLLNDWDSNRLLIYGDETGEGLSAPELLSKTEPTPCAFLVGPEGGFSPNELATLRNLPFTKAISLGPRVLRADTAALAGITCLQLWLGDWGERPRA